MAVEISDRDREMAVSLWHWLGHDYPQMSAKRAEAEITRIAQAIAEARAEGVKAGPEMAAKWQHTADGAPVIVGMALWRGPYIEEGVLVPASQTHHRPHPYLFVSGVARGYESPVDMRELYSSQATAEAAEIVNYDRPSEH